MPIIGTAGHVDHGKSTLVLALTGIDPDRLAEEKRRGMTIDLGFAHIDLAGGVRAGIVDVPGHARFLPNMLAGVHGMDAVLLVVAADEGVMPQTREHLDVLGLLGVDRVIVALTKTDLVDPGMIDLVEADVVAELGTRGLAADMVRVAAPTGAGVDELRASLSRVVADLTAIDLGRPRLPVDRAFVMTGFGTVVTGTLVDGALRVGDEVELLPAWPSGARPLRGRARGLQQHGAAVAVALPGNRTAVNLQGIDREQVRRGQVLGPPGTVSATRRLDLRLAVLSSASISLRHNDRVAVHTGTAEAMARAVVLDGVAVEPGATGWIQLQLSRPLAVRDGDGVVVRRPSPAETLGGGRVADATAPLHRRRDGGAVAALERRLGGGGRLMEELRKAPQGLTLDELATRLAAPASAVAAEVPVVLAAGAVVRVGEALLDAARWTDLERAAADEVTRFHAANPLRAGMPRAALAGTLGVRGRRLGEAVATLLARGVLAAFGPEGVALPGWKPRLSPVEEDVVEAALTRLGAAPLAPPGMAELAAAGLTGELSAYLEETGSVVRLAPDVLVLPTALADAEHRVRAHLTEHGTITVAEARDLLGSSRRMVVPLLEYLDGAHVTRRDGDLRRLRHDATPID